MIQTNAIYRIYIFLILCLSLFINISYIFVVSKKCEALSKPSKNIVFLLGTAVFFASIPLSIDSMLPGSGDLIYHLMRVEGIKDGLLSGQFPIRISPEWQQGFGYASPIFYGETILYIAGFLRLIGFSVTATFRIFMFIITVATVLIAYFCFNKIFSNPYIAVLCSSLYSLSIYRIYKTYICGSWGECFGIMLLPLFAYGFYRVFTQDIHEKTYAQSYIPLTIGFTFLIQSHLLTGEMVGLFTILLCLILWKKVFRIQTFIVLAKTVIYSILLSGWFLVPFADYMLTGDFVIQHVSARTIQSRGLYPAHLFFTFFEANSAVFFEQDGMYASAPTGVGITLLVALFIALFLLYTGKANRLSPNIKALCKISCLFAVLSMLMSLNIFPWDRIQFLNDITKTLVSSIQFPNRFLTIANICLCLLAGVAAEYFVQNHSQLVFSLYLGSMLFLLTISSLYLTDSMMNSMAGASVYNNEGMGTGYIAGAEYLPYGADASLFLYHEPISQENISVSEYTKLPLGASAAITNDTAFPADVSFPLLFYKGYKAISEDSGEELSCFPGDNFEVTVEIPPNFSGNISVAFESPWYWRLGELTSLLTFFALSVCFIKHKKEAK